jgi:outer membrane protein
MMKLSLPLLSVALSSAIFAQSPSNAGPFSEAQISAPSNAVPGAQSPVMNQPAPGNAGPALSLADAEARALQHQPRLLAQKLRAQAANRQISEAKSVYYPQLYGNLTAVQANGDSAVAAGAVTTSSVSTRAAGGLNLVQLVTDFGRTRNLVRSAKYSAQASSQTAESVRQQIIRDVDNAYFGLQAAESVQKTTQAVLDFRRTSLRQLSALAQSQLKSTLDVQFAQVLVSEAELAVVHANSNVEVARAELTEAMGDNDDTAYALSDQPLPQSVDDSYTAYVNDAMKYRPDLQAIKLHANSAEQYASAQKKLYAPTLNVLGTAGEVPTHDETIQHEYGAVGVNLNIPVFNGGLYSARAGEAKLNAQAANRDVENLSIQIARDVKTAWAAAKDAYLEIQVAQKLVDQTNEAMHLSQARYDAGLGSIVELNQAELNQTSALITAASARFNYQQARTQLDYTIGITH